MRLRLPNRVQTMKNLQLKLMISVEHRNLKWVQLVTEHHLLMPVDRSVMPIFHWNKQKDLPTAQDKCVNNERHLSPALRIHRQP